MRPEHLGKGGGRQRKRKEILKRKNQAGSWVVNNQGYPQKGALTALGHTETALHRQKKIDFFYKGVKEREACTFVQKRIIRVTRLQYLVSSASRELHKTQPTLHSCIQCGLQNADGQVARINPTAFLNAYLQPSKHPPPNGLLATRAPYFGRMPVLARCLLPDILLD